jgi:prepilin-type N-terminal cleavage/methylation domain-containing protein
VKGFSLLEALVAMTILGLAATTSLAALGSQVRSADRARVALIAEAVMQDRLARLRLASAAELARLPDSLSRGQMPAPWEAARWRTASRNDRERADLFQVSVEVVSGDSRFGGATRLYRPRLTSHESEP